MSVTQIDVPPVSFKDKGGDGRRRHQIQSEMTCPLRPCDGSESLSLELQVVTGTVEVTDE
jgi:hypothetical protein